MEGILARVRVSFYFPFPFFLTRSFVRSLTLSCFLGTYIHRVRMIFRGSSLSSRPHHDSETDSAARPRIKCRVPHEWGCALFDRSRSVGYYACAHLDELLSDDARCPLQNKHFGVCVYVCMATVYTFVKDKNCLLHRVRSAAGWDSSAFAAKSSDQPALTSLHCRQWFLAPILQPS